MIGRNIEPGTLRTTLLDWLEALPRDPQRFRQDVERFVRAWGPTGVAALMELARRHCVSGVIAAHLPTDVLDFPSDVRQSIEVQAAAEALWHEHLVLDLADVVGLLDRAGIQACTLKGPALATRLYADPITRPSLDIDLMVREDDLDAATSILIGAGYVTTAGPTGLYLRRHAHHLSFTRTNRPPIELHFRAYAGFGVVVPAAEVMDRSVEHLVREGCRVRVLSPEDEFLYLAIHAAGHSFVRLLWLYDLKLLLQQHVTLDFDAVADRAEAFGVTAAVAYTIHLLKTWMKMSLNRIPDRLQRRGARTRVADVILAQVSTPRLRPTWDNLGGLLFTSLLCDTVPSSAWLVQHHVRRMTRRRLQRLAPGYLPERWSA